MDCLYFNLSGRMAHLKNPEMNNYLELTYNNIHKPCLTGLMGAILGLDGFLQMKDNDGKLEYWEKLKGLKVSIVPKEPQFTIITDETTNTSGFANNNATQVLIRQFLINPSWDIYVLKGSIDDELWEELKYRVINKISKYPLKLGNNKCRAFINNGKIIKIENLDIEEIEYCNSILKYKHIVDIENDKHEESEYDYLFSLTEYMPTDLDELTKYITEKTIFTNSYIEVDNGKFYKCGELVLNFI